MNRPETVTLSAQEGEASIDRLSAYVPRVTDCQVLIKVVRWHFWLVFALQESTLGLKRLRALLFGKAPKPHEPPASETWSPSAPPVGAGDNAGESWPGEEAAPVAHEVRAETQPGVSDAESTPKPTGGQRPGTGRLGADAYAGAERVACRHEELAVGQRCPVCGQGTLYALPPGAERRIDGHALLSALRYERHKLRCSACGQICTAALPDEAGDEKYSARARAVLVVGRYYRGLPFYRLHGYQAMLGVPVPDATPWEQIEKVGDGGSVVFAYLETLAAQGELISQDDTSVRMLSLMAENLTLQAQAEAMGF